MGTVPLMPNGFPTISGNPDVWVVCDDVQVAHWPLGTCENERAVPAPPRELLAALA